MHRVRAGCAPVSFVSFVLAARLTAAAAARTEVYRRLDAGPRSHRHARSLSPSVYHQSFASTSADSGDPVIR
jgi:hypothetical protein